MNKHKTLYKGYHATGGITPSLHMLNHHVVDAHYCQRQYDYF